MRIDEAETAIAFASNWLELDASDDWVRTDAETVSSPLHLSTPNLAKFIVTNTVYPLPPLSFHFHIGSSPGNLICILPQY